MSTPPLAPGAPPTSHSRAEELRDHVTARVEALQRAYVDPRHGQNSWATGALACLRRAVGDEPGRDPAVWELVYDGIPARLVGGEDPRRSGEIVVSTAERAVHASLTLYAVHQQSQRVGMHRRDVGLGTAVRRLALATGAESAVLRRFHALGTAQSLTEVLHHARGLLTQLRAAAIPLDHGRLAVDLDRLQRTGHADRVRLQWGRDYYARRPQSAPTEQDSTTVDGPEPATATTTRTDQGETR